MLKKLWMFLLIFTLMLSVTGISFADTPVQGDIKGNLVIVGGALGSSNAGVYEKFIELAGGKDKAKIGIIPAASGSLKSSKAFMADFIRYGVPEANVEIIPITLSDDRSTKDVDESTWAENVGKQEIADKIKGYTGIWFVGGDQSLITKALLKADGTNTLALDAIWEVYKNGDVLGGTSAGAAIMSDPMISGGNSLGTINYGSTDTYIDEADQYAAPVYIEKGLGFFPYGVTDQHFDMKARLARLVFAADKYKDLSTRAFGVDENTAMVYSAATKTFEVIGPGSVTVVDVSKAVRDTKSKQLSIKNVQLSFLTIGDTYDAAAGKFISGTTKDKTTGAEYFDIKGPVTDTGALTSYGQFRPFIMYYLIDNAGTSEIKSYCFDEKGVGAEIVFRKTADTIGYWNYKDGLLDNYSASNVALDINPIKVTIKPASKATIQSASLEYVVQSGDVLWKIATRFNTTVEKLSELNKLINPNALEIGQTLLIPQQ